MLLAGGPLLAQKAKGINTRLGFNSAEQYISYPWLFRLEWRPMVVACSTLRQSEKNSIRRMLAKIGGDLGSNENK